MARAEKKEPLIRIVVSPVYDLLMALYGVANPNDCEESVSEFAIKVRETLRPRLLSNLLRYFESSSYPGFGLLSLVGDEYTRDVPTLLQTLSKMPASDLATALLSFGKIYRGNLRVERRIEELLADRALLLEHIEKNMSVPANKVEMLADLVLDVEKARDDLAELIEHFWYVIIAPEATQRAQVQQEIAEQTLARLEQLGPGRMFTAMTNLVSSSGEAGYEEVILAPSSFADTRITANDNKEETCLVLVYGAGHDALKVSEDKSEYSEPLDPERLAKIYNILSDETRLKLVRALVERPHYGQELAKLLGISNATVFHHLSMLEHQDLVYLERIEHRVYYILKTERLRQLLTQGTLFVLG
jgi:DNA-binding transcriptional ArsR family regulator